MLDETNIETIEFRAVAPVSKSNLRGLDEALGKLNALDSALKSINSRWSGIAQPVVFKKSIADIKEMIAAADRLQKFAPFGGLKANASMQPKNIAAVLGFDADAVQRFLTQAVMGGATKAQKDLQRQVRKFYSASGGEFRSVLGAQQGLSLFTKHFDPKQDPLSSLKMLFSGMGPMSMPMGAMAGGNIQNIGNIMAAQAAAARAAGAPTGKAKGKSKKEKVIVDDDDEDEDESGPTDTSTPKGNVIQRQERRGKTGRVRSVRTRYADANVTTDVVANAKGERKRSVVTTDLRAAAREEFERTGEKVQADFLKQMGAVSTGPRDRRIDKIRALADNMAQTIASMAGNSGFAALPKRQVEAGLDKLKKAIAKAALAEIEAIQEDMAKAPSKGQTAFARAQTQAQAARDRAAANVAALEQREDRRRMLARQRMAKMDAKQASEAEAVRNNLQAVGTHWQNFLASGGVETPTSGKMMLGRTGWTRELRAERKVPGQNMTEVFVAKIGEAEASFRRYNKALTDTKAAESAWLGDFIKNTAKVTAWATSVGVLYKSIEVARESFEDLVEIGPKVGRLEQVFRGVGGSAQELAADTLHLAAVNGQSTEEAMESAINWSRLGLTRVQVNEAVRLSLIAANVAQLSVEETTQHLQAIMQNYGLTVGQLSAKLGEMVQISNIYNVTNAEMLQGISRTSAVAKQAGLPFEELLGILGATVGATKQSGANIGNAIKTMIVALSNPALQEKLRTQFQFESTTGGENIKQMNGLLADLYVRYEKLNDAERQSMLFSVGGRYQASRMAAILDNYVRAQTLAINAQLHLNTAEQENLKIIDTMKAGLTGVADEWERFVYIQGNRGPVQAIEGITTAFRNLLALMNSPAGSTAMTGILAVMTAASARTLLTGIAAKDAIKGGFIGRSVSSVAGAGRTLNSWMNATIAGFVGSTMPRAAQFAAPIHPSLVQPSLLGRFVGGMGQMGQMGQMGGLAMARMGFGQIFQGANAGIRTAGALNVALGGTAAVLGTITKALAVAGVALAEFFAPIAVIIAGVIAFNKGMEILGLSSEAAQKKLAGFNDEAQKAAAAASAMAEASTLMGTMSKALSPDKGLMRPEDAKRMITQGADAFYADESDLKVRQQKADAMRQELLTMVDQNRMAEVRQKLDERGMALMSSRKKYLQDEYQAGHEAVQANAAEIARLQNIQKGPMGLFFHDSRTQKISELQAAQADLEGKQTQNIIDQQSELDDYLQDRLSYDEKHLAALESEKTALEGIAQLYQMIKTNNPLEQNAAAMYSAQAQSAAAGRHIELLNKQDETDYTAKNAINDRVKNLKAQEDALRGQMLPMISGGGKTGVPAFATPFAQQQHAGIQQQIDDIEKQIADAQTGRLLNPDGTQAAVTLGVVSRAQQREADIEAKRKADAEAAARAANVQTYEQQARFGLGQAASERGLTQSSYGYNQGDITVRQRNSLLAETARLEKEISTTQEGSAQWVQLEGEYLNDLYLRNKNLNDLLEQRSDIQRQIYQLTVDSNREFMKSFFGAGPEEMLQKLAAFRMTMTVGPDGRPQARPMTQGQFFSMSPDMRQSVGQLNPQFNPEMIELKNAQQEISDAITKAFGSLDLSKIDDGLVKASEQLAAAIGKFEAGGGKTPADAEAERMDNASKVIAGGAQKFSDAVDRFTVNVVQKLIDKLGGNGTNGTGATNGTSVPRSPQSGGFGGGRGIAGN